MAENGSPCHSTSVNSLMVIGKLIMNAKRKNHFRSVTLLYLDVSGLTTIKYIPKEAALIKIKVLPSGIFGAVALDILLNMIRIKAPIKPRTAPEIFKKVIFSRMSIADKINTRIGVIVEITDELIGVVKLKPLKEKSIFITIPNSVHASILGQSLR